MSNRAYVETKEPLLQTAPLRFKSAKLGVSEMVYSLVFKPHSFPLSVIPNISIALDNTYPKRKWGRPLLRHSLKV